MKELLRQRAFVLLWVGQIASGWGACLPLLSRVG